MGNVTLRQLLESLLALAKARFGQNRVFIPFLFTLAQLAEAGSFDVAANDEEYAQPLRDLLRISCSALEKTRSRARLSATSRVFVTSQLTNIGRISDGCPPAG